MRDVVHEQSGYSDDAQWIEADIPARTLLASQLGECQKIVSTPGNYDGEGRHMGLQA